MIKKLSHLPVIIDPSHATGLPWMVEPMTLAAIAAGADGVMIEVHNDPPKALCDGAQSLTSGPVCRADAEGEKTERLHENTVSETGKGM